MAIPGVGKLRIWKRLQVLDYLVIAFALGVFIFTLLLALRMSTDASEVSIKAGDQVYVYRLDKNIEFEVQGPLGATKIEIKDKAVRIVDSPCRDKICVHSGWLRNGGQWAACLPNKVFVSINAGKADVLDAATY